MGLVISTPLLIFGSMAVMALAFIMLIAQLMLRIRVLNKDINCTPEPDDTSNDKIRGQYTACTRNLYRVRLLSTIQIFLCIAALLVSVIAVGIIIFRHTRGQKEITAYSGPKLSNTVKKRVVHQPTHPVKEVDKEVVKEANPAAESVKESVKEAVSSTSGEVTLDDLL